MGRPPCLASCLAVPALVVGASRELVPGYDHCRLILDRKPVAVLPFRDSS